MLRQISQSPSTCDLNVATAAICHIDPPSNQLKNQPATLSTGEYVLLKYTLPRFVLQVYLCDIAFQLLLYYFPSNTGTRLS